MSASLNIPQIPSNLRVPLTYFSVSPSNSQQNQVNQRTLIIGDSYNNGVANALTPVQSVAQAQNTFGIRAPITKMIEAYTDNDNLGTLYALPFQHAAGATAATGAMVFTGTAIAAGEISAYIAGENVIATVNNGDTAATIATSMYNAINAVPDLPLFATNGTAGTTTLTASTLGLSAGQIDVRVNYYGPPNNEVLPPGVTLAITPMAGGTSNPSLSGLAALVGDLNFDFIICQYNDSVSVAALVALLNDSAGRWAPSRKVYGHAFVGDIDTYANLLTYGGAQNNQHLTVWGVFDAPSTNWIWAAAHTGAAAVSLRADPARPLQTLAVEGVLAPPQTSQFTKANQQALLSEGIALSQYDQAGDVSILRAVTTYQFNAFGQPDQSYLDVETLFSLMLFIRTIDGAISQKFGRSKLADDGTKFGAGQAIVTPSIISNELIAQYNQMELDGLVEDTQTFAAGLVVVRNDQNASRVDVLLDPYLVSGLRIFAALVEFSLNSPSVAAAA